MFPTLPFKVNYIPSEPGRSSYELCLLPASLGKPFHWLGMWVSTGSPSSPWDLPFTWSLQALQNVAFNQARAWRPQCPLPEGQACCLLPTWGRIFEGESQVGFYNPVSEITQRVDRKLTTEFFRAVGVAFQKEAPAGTGLQKQGTCRETLWDSYWEQRAASALF